MLAFHNNPGIKSNYIMRVAFHEAADEIVQGQYWQNGKGCAVGCTLHGSVKSRYERELGIPVELADLEEVIFENLSNVDAKTFPQEFLRAIPVGADLKFVGTRFLHWLFTGDEIGFSKIKADLARTVVDRVAGLLDRKIQGDYDFREWESAGSEASNAADELDFPDYKAAYAACFALHGDMAEATEYARSYLDSDDIWPVMRRKLISLLEEAPVPLVEVG